MREFDVTCPECGERYRVNEPMMRTLRETGCVLCTAPLNDAAKSA
ncbi:MULTISPECIES: DUF7560 family zinc ribbon protein [Haloferax]|uniref:Small CPxCG-related zinc finger protein n=5 Tax=Haloferax TaxID=2251 RepID=D4GW58_HALVD|nr:MULTISPECIES: hypothetical protein [Haloferax]ADE02928.1 small CPxCG-related zinc finger protein [Haloferax volcanii DS2]ELK55430.1 hypothetical protein D320_04615 [Haloferax sp. BAB-2207]ELY28192.1 hypothetical protein C498_13153 [Haloferax volcanii DS2]ELZ59843.1 hypothetical protein C460_05536 [Haloferax sp. ATCC BAA-646]ELZ64557.1 hypothetical protein C459_08510 [Haloferax sp. ATCC BAA-645]